jgi:tetratricopeptide (TPR) repeat protein
MSNKRLYFFMKYTAIAGVAAWVGWSFYAYLNSRGPGDFEYHAAVNYFSDGYYQQALQEYEQAIRKNANHLAAKLGKAETLIMLQREREAIKVYEELLKIQPDNAGHYRNLGIAYDRLKEPENALKYYKKALALMPDIADGPSWLTRFLRNQSKKPPDIVERTAYLETQLALPEQQRLLYMPELDKTQKPYKILESLPSTK